METRLNVTILPQPDDTSCGPTCLHAIYRYYGIDFPLAELITDIESLDKGGTLGVVLANHALQSGFKVTLFTYNLLIFDPTWFNGKTDIEDKLRMRARFTTSGKQRFAIKQYRQFLSNGGQIRLEDMNRRMLTNCLNKGIPILTGLTSTYLYRNSRIDPKTNKDDDIRGRVEGHFVVLDGYEKEKRLVSIADPYQKNPISGTTSYRITIDRVINAILLGVLTYDANFIVIEPQSSQRQTS
jgi:hypothetical protein